MQVMNGSVSMGPREWKIRSKSPVKRRKSLSHMVVHTHLFLTTTGVHRCKLTFHVSHSYDMTSRT